MGRGLGRPLLCLGLTEDGSVEEGGAASVGDASDSERHFGETGGVLLVVPETSSVWRSVSFPSVSDVT